MHTDNDRQCRFFFLLQECTWIWILFLLFLRSLDQFRCILLCGEYRIRTRRHIWGSCTRTLVKRTQHSARMCGLDEVFNDFRWARNRQICAFPHSHYGASARKSNSDEKYQVVRILHIVLGCCSSMWSLTKVVEHITALSLPLVSLALCASMHCLCLLKWFPWIALM